MPNEAFAWGTRIKDVEREYNTVRLAMDRLQQHARENPAVLRADLRFRNIGVASEHLGGTYVVRLFSEFETALRLFMLDNGYRVPKQTEALLNRVSDRADISNDDTDNAHAVREFRNALVHHREEPADPISVRDSTRHLGTFLAWLQRYW